LVPVVSATGDNDLAHNRADRRHLRSNVVRQVAKDGAEPFLYRLPRSPDVRTPIELDMYHREPEPGLRADILHSGSTENGGFQRICDKRFDLFWSESRALGHDRDLGPIEVREDIDRHGCGRVPAVYQCKHAQNHDKWPMPQRKLDDGIEHRRSIMGNG
jgi:hypothetical protein